MDWSFLRNFGITLFALLNPLGMLPIFIAYTSRERVKVQRMVALFVSLTVMVLLLIFMVIGSPMLKFFGVTISSFRIAGGILLLIIGINLVNGNGNNDANSLLAPENSNDLTKAKSVYRQIVIPMAMPLLVGPGVIANVILYANEALVRRKGLGLELMGVTIIVCFFLFAVLVSGKWLQQAMGEIGLSITQRVMGLFVAAIGVQFMVTGIIDIIIYDFVPKLKG